MELTQAKLKTLLKYNPDTGLFIWNVKRGPCRAGSEAGRPHNRGYRRIGLYGRDYLVHRLAFLYMTGRWPKEIDHINRVKDDNRWVNLRECSRLDNCMNTGKRKRNISGVKGVRPVQGGKWNAFIYLRGEHIYLGNFLDWFDAVCARKSAEHIYGFKLPS